jgi:hypothetical protein
LTDEGCDYDDYTTIHPLSNINTSPPLHKNTTHQSPPSLVKLTVQTQEISHFVEETLFILSVIPYYLRYSLCKHMDYV